MNHPNESQDANLSIECLESRLVSRPGHVYGDIHIHGSGPVQLGDHVRYGEGNIAFSAKEEQMLGKLTYNRLDQD